MLRVAKVYDTPDSPDECLAALEQQVWLCERAPGDLPVGAMWASVVHAVLETVALISYWHPIRLLTGMCYAVSLMHYATTMLDALCHPNK